MNKILKTITLGGIYLVPFVPLVVTNSLFFPYITGKNFAFRILVQIIFASWLIWAIRDSGVRPKKSWIFISVISLMIVMILSAFFGQNLYRSLWSNFERMEGVMGYFHVFMYLFVFGSVMNKTRFLNFVSISIGVAITIALYGILQLLGAFSISQGGARVDGTLGNAIYMAGYMLINFFLAICLSINRGQDITKRSLFSVVVGINLFLVFLVYRWLTAEVVPIQIDIFILVILILDFLLLWQRRKLLMAPVWFSRSVYTLSAVLFLYMVYLTQTRGAILGIIGGIVITLLINSIFLKGRLKKISVSLILIAVVLGGIFLSIKNTDFVQNDKTLSRLANISLHDRTTSSRLTIWGMALDGAMEKPILGWGNDNFNYVFNKNYEPKLLGNEEWFDRSHNIVIDWFVHTGILGLISYLMIFIASLYYLWKKTMSFSGFEKSVITGLVSAYFIQNLFVFDNISVLLLFIPIVGIIHYSSVSNDNSDYVSRKRPKDKTFTYGISAIVLIAFIFSQYFVNIKPVYSAYLLSEANKLTALNYSKVALETYKDVISMNTMATQEAREHLLRSGQRSLANNRTTPEVRIDYFNTGISEMEKKLLKSDEDLRDVYITASYLRAFGALDQALLMIDKALDLSPRKPSIYHMQADIYVNQGEMGLALDSMKRAYDLWPEADENQINYAATLILNKEIQKAEDLLDNHGNIRYMHDPRIIRALDRVGEDRKLLEIRKDYIEKNPEDVEEWKAVADLYNKLGMKSEAAEAKIKELKIRLDRVGENPENYSFHIDLYRLYSELGDEERAKNSLQNAISITEEHVSKNKRDIQSWDRLLNYYILSGDIDNARSAVQNVIRLYENEVEDHPTEVHTRISLASYYLAVGRGEESIQLLQKTRNIKRAPVDYINRLIDEIAKGGNPWAN